MSKIEELRTRATRIAPRPERVPRRAERPEVLPPGTGSIWVVVRGVNEEQFEITVQRVRYSTRPSQEGVVEAFGPDIIAYPIPGHAIEPWANIPNLIKPHSETETTLGVNFYACKLHREDNTLELPIKMPAGVTYVDPEEQTTEGGGV